MSDTMPQEGRNVLLLSNGADRLVVLEALC